MPSIKKIKVIASPNIPKEKVKDMLGDGLHLLHRFEDEMGNHPFGHKLISIGKPMMMGGLHNVMDMMTPEVIPHLCHHLDHHPEHHHGCHHHHGPKCCIEFMNNICKCIMLFFIWKIIEAVKCRECGLSEAHILRQFKKDLKEQYGKINKVNTLLSETTLVLNESHINALKVRSLIMLSEDLGGKASKVMGFVQQQIPGGMNDIIASAMKTFDITNPLVQAKLAQAVITNAPLASTTMAVARDILQDILMNTTYGQQLQLTAKEKASGIASMVQQGVANLKQSVSNGVQDMRNGLTNTLNAGNPNYVQAQRVGNNTIGGFPLK